MIDIKMGSSTRLCKHLGITIHIPGGWIARIARATVEPTVTEAYAAYFVSCGVQANKAWALALKTVQQTYNQGYCKGLRECVSRRAEEYAEMWPQHRQPFTLGKRAVTLLRGFNPALVQQMYVPYQIRGRRGQEYVKGMLADMGRQANG